MSTDARLVFIADGGPQIGLGHLSRCLALAHYLHGRYPMLWLTHSANDWLAEQCKILEIKLIKQTHPDLSAEIKARIHPGDVAVCDSYTHTTAHHRAVLDAGARLLVISDFATASPVADVVVNTAPSATAELYPTPLAFTQVATGSSYALLRPPFSAAASKPPVDSPRKGILICLGGADAPNHSGRLAEALAALGQPITIIIGPSNPHLPALSERAESGAFTVLHSLDAEALANAFRHCAVAVTSASSLAQEASAVGTPLVIAQTADNQALLYRGLIERGAALGAPISDTDALTEHAKRLLSDAHLRAAQLKAQRSTYDGAYAVRWQALFTTLDSGLWLRRARAEDAQALFDWANDPLTRANSYQSAHIAWADHLAWLDRRIRDAHTTLWIVMAGQQAVGQIRLQRNADRRESVLSIGLAPAARGRGLAAPALARAVQAYGARHPGEPIHATIKLGNAASVRAFERAGFVFQPDTVIEGQPSHHCIFVP